MNPITHLLSSLTGLSAKFSQATIKLGYGETSDVFLANIYPTELLKSDREFRADAGALFAEFIREFEGKNLVFITDDNFTKLEEPLFEWRAGIMTSSTADQPPQVLIGTH
ncbi:hypothetical protein [Dyadobacter luticola]|uniref:Uncharacterized protein n=1 Tax=Dyadobacter luticola TaxID=1979387 RepID=A0A5R9L2K1_9BACT|nr:hypothetical protein [Dyadobacter luticola]TLV02525.1 hypothetical protein FEN17_02570 [Dyadobacter luticola]